MKLVIAVVPPHRMETVRDALVEAGMAGMTLIDVQGYGRQRGHVEVFRGHEYTVNMVHKVEIQVAVADEHLDRCITAIERATRSGRIGDGKIFVVPLEQAVRIRTQERGEEAL